MGTLSSLNIDHAAAREKYGPWAVIAGGSDGSGEAYARELAALGINVMLVARRKDVLDALAQDLRAQYGIETRTLVQDLMETDAAHAMLQASADLDVGLYISNAGCDGTGSHFFEQPIERWRRLITMNVQTVTEAVHGFGNRLIKRGRGGIILMSSGGGLGGTPYLATYAGTKGYEIIFTEGMWGELADRNVDILCVMAASMDTPFFRREIAGGNFKLGGLHTPEEIVRGGLENLGRKPLLMFPCVRRPPPEVVMQTRYDELQESIAAGKTFFKSKRSLENCAQTVR